jgi:hypothetical protein
MATYTLPTVVSGSINQVTLSGKTTTTVPLLGTPQDGDLLVFAIEITTSNGQPSSMAGWTQLTYSSIGSRRAILYTKPWAEGESSYVFATPGSGEGQATLFLLRNVATVTAGTFKGRSTSPTETTTTTGLSVTTTIANTLVLGFNWEATPTADTIRPTVNSGWSTVSDQAESPSGVYEQIFISSMAMATPGATGAQTVTWQNALASAGGGQLVQFIPNPDSSTPTISITSPSAGASLKNPRPVFSGTSSPSTPVTLTNSSGTTLGSSTSDGSGNWSITPTQDLPGGTNIYTATQVVSGTSTSATVSFTNNPGLAINIVDPAGSGTIKTARLYVLNSSRVEVTPTSITRV